MKPKSFVPYTSILNNKEDNTDNILIKLEKTFVILFRHKEESFYENFDNQVSVYLNKISGHSKDVCLQLLNRKALLVGINSKKVNNILGCFSMAENNKLLFCAVESSLFDIELTDGSIGNIEEMVNQYYYQFIRYSIKSNSEITKNFDLHGLLIQYFTFLFLKVLKIPTVVDKKVDVLKYVVGVMYFKHFLKMDSGLAKEKSLSFIDDKLKSEVTAALPDTFINKYTDIKDIIKLVIDCKIVFDTPNNLTYQMLSSLKVISFLSITSTFDHLLASVIASITSTDYYKPLMINRQLQENIEKQILPLFTKAKYEELSKFSIGKTTKMSQD